MFALFWKDVLAQRKTLRVYALFLILYTVIGVFTDNSAFFLAFIVMLAIMLPMNALTSDQACGWARYAACLPISPIASVSSKYLLSILGMAVSLIPVLLFHLLSQFTDRLTDPISVSTVLLLVFSGLVLLAIQMPFLFLLGPERGRFVTMGLLILLMLGIPLLSLQDNIAALDEQLMTQTIGLTQPYLWGLPLLGIVLNLISIGISFVIVRRQDVA